MTPYPCIGDPEFVPERFHDEEEHHDGGWSCDGLTYCDPIPETNGEPWYCDSCNCQDFDPDYDSLESECHHHDDDHHDDEGPPECIAECINDVAQMTPDGMNPMEGFCGCDSI